MPGKIIMVTGGAAAEKANLQNAMYCIILPNAITLLRQKS